MTTTVKRRGKKIRDSNIISDELCKTQNSLNVDIFKRDISKLIFDDFKQSEEEYNKKPMSNRKKRLHAQSQQNKINQFKGESLLLKPSFMNWTEHEEYYQTPQKNKRQEENQQKISTTFTKRKERLRTAKSICKGNYQKFNIQTSNPEKKEDILQKIDQQKKFCNINKTVCIQMPKQKINFINNFQFQSEQEQEECPSDKIQNKPIIQIDFFPTEQLHINYIQEQTQYLSDHQYQQQEIVFPDKQHLDQNELCQTSLIQSNTQIDQKSMYFEQILNQKDREDNISQLMYAPIVSGTRIIFEVHLYSTLMEKSYQFWLDQGRQMKLLMKATKYSKLSKNTFEMLTYLPSKKLFCSSCTMQTNLQRNQFNIYKNTPDKKNLILATICNLQTLSGQKCMVMYYPKINEGNSVEIIPQTTLIPNLHKHYKQGQHSRIDYLMTTKIPIQDRLKMMTTYGFKASKKSMQFKNKKKQLQIVIGKMGSKRYRIVAGSKITPIQIFGLVIAQIET